MSRSKAAGRQLQILSTIDSVQSSQQLDLLSFVSDYALADYSVKEKQTRTKPTTVQFHGHVDKNKTFQTFCTGDSNQFAVESVKRFILNERTDHNLLFLKAASGLGKTHILHAAANDLLLKKKAFYLSSPLIMSALLDTFHLLKNYEFLFIDDVEEIEQNSELQTIFCQLMDFAQSGHMKIIFTGNKLPKELKADERFKGKLSAALIHHISGINPPLAFDIVSSKSRNMNFPLPENVKELVASQLEFNVYGLESIMHKLKNISEMNKTPMTIEVAKQEIQVKDKTLNHSLKPLLVDVANSFDISVENLLSSVRKKEFALARHTAMFILREKENMNVMKIAGLFGKDHSSVIYAVEKIRTEIASDIKLKNKIERILSSYA